MHLPCGLAQDERVWEGGLARRAWGRPGEGQGVQQLGPGVEHQIAGQGLQVLEEAHARPKRRATQAVTERSERTAQGYRRFCCRACGKHFNERSGTLLNRTQYPSDVIALVVLWRLRYK